jgi:hypothetical protein
MSHTNDTGVTQKGQITDISFCQVHFSKKIKKGQNIKKFAYPG